jgi:hypothetical protein
MPFDPNTQSRFGTSMNMSGFRCIIGAIGANQRGAAYVYRLLEPGWIFEQKLNIAVGTVGDAFGWGVDISGDLIAIGAIRRDDTAEDAGAAYIYRYDHGLSSWLFEEQLLASNGGVEDLFGLSVAVRGDIAVVTAPQSDAQGMDAGAAYCFTFNGTSWDETQILAPADLSAGEGFGWSVTLRPTRTVLVGTIFDQDNGEDAGSVYQYLDCCPADLDGDGTVSVVDMLAMLGDWGLNPGHPADLTDDGVVGITDFLMLLAQWGMCP